MAACFTGRGTEEPGERRGEERVTLGWLPARLAAFAGLHPGFDVPGGRLATRLARASDEDGERRTARPESDRDKADRACQPLVLKGASQVIDNTAWPK